MLTLTKVNKRDSVGFITKPRMTHKNLPSFTEPSINIAGMFQSYISLVLGWSHIFCDMSQRYGVLFRDILHGFLYSVNADHTNMIYKNTPRTLTYWV